MWVEKNGKTWRIRDEVGDGRKVDLSKGHPTKTAAKHAMAQLRADQLRGDGLVPRGDRVTLGEWLDIWWPDYERRLKPTAQASEGARVRNHIRPLLGAVPLGDLDRVTLNRWVSDLEDGLGPALADSGRRRRKLAPKTVGNCHGLLYVILQAAVEQRLIRVNPAVGTRLPHRAHHEMRHLTDPEIGRLVAAMPAHWRPLVVLLVGTGLRWGEAIGLRAGRVDLLAQPPVVRVEEQLQELGDGSLIVCTPKSARSRRTVTITRQIAMMLTGLVAGKERDDLVFASPTGLTVRTRNFRRVWLTACAAAGLSGLRVHDLRHTHAAILLSDGVSMERLSRRLGHAAQAVTDAVYGHLRVGADEDVTAAVDAALAGLDPILAAEVRAEFADEFADAA
jgi:integrase